MKNGNIYLVTHSRKGVFKMFVESQCEVWARGFITDGKADAATDYNRKEQFDSIAVRKSLCSFTEKI